MTPLLCVVCLCCVCILQFIRLTTTNLLLRMDGTMNVDHCNAADHTRKDTINNKITTPAVYTEWQRLDLLDWGIWELIWPVIFSRKGEL
jgi:hypothetical protein